MALSLYDGNWSCLRPSPDHWRARSKGQGASPKECHGRVASRRLRLCLGRADGPLPGLADPPHAAPAVLARGLPGLLRDPAGRLRALDLLRDSSRQHVAGRPQQHRPSGRAHPDSRRAPPPPRTAAKRSLTAVAVTSGGASQTCALKISTSTSPSYPAAATAAAIGAKSMHPSPR